jgi:hypothetical protein
MNESKAKYQREDIPVPDTEPGDLLFTVERHEVIGEVRAGEGDNPFSVGLAMIASEIAESNRQKGPDARGMFEFAFAGNRITVIQDPNPTE